MGIEKAGVKITGYITASCRRLAESQHYVKNNAVSYLSDPHCGGMAFVQSMSKEEAIEMMSLGHIKSFSALDRRVPIKLSGRITEGRWIDGGGSKCAYRVKLDDEEVCILLPHANWGGAVNEPKNTMILKKLGLITNDYCKIIPVEVEGVKIPALVSKPYDKHSFKIFDKKNPNDALEKYFDIEKMNENNIEEIFTPLLKDIKTLIDNDIRLAYDSFNIALKDGQLRLYLNDLPYEKLVRKGNKDDLFKLYSDYTMEAVSASFSWDAARKNKFIDSLSGLEGQDKLFPKLLDLYNKL